MGLGSSAPAELLHARVSRVEADHALELGDRDEQWAVGVALAQQCVHLQHRMDGITGVDARAVIDDSLEDRQCPEPHATMLADAGT